MMIGDAKYIGTLKNLAQNGPSLKCMKFKNPRIPNFETQFWGIYDGLQMVKQVLKVVKCDLVKKFWTLNGQKWRLEGGCVSVCKWGRRKQEENGRICDGILS